MGTEADTLVTKHPDRVSQLLGPVYGYLKRKMPFSPGDQDLYMSVFFPAARKVPSWTTFESLYRKLWPENWREKFEKFKTGNPGILLVSDYIGKVNSRTSRPALPPRDREALDEISGKLGVSPDSLYRLINFESRWDPKARNPSSGARGLIQFMPFTAKEMGYGATGGGGIAVLALAGLGAVLMLLKRRMS